MLKALVFSLAFLASGAALAAEDFDKEMRICGRHKVAPPATPRPPGFGQGPAANPNQMVYHPDFAKACKAVEQRAKDQGTVNKQSAHDADLQQLQNLTGGQ